MRATEVRKAGWQIKRRSENYSFDDVGNVLGYKNDCMNGSRYSTEQTYTYDALYQLIKAEGVTEDNPYAIPNSPDYRSNYEQNFAFDAIGNMTYKKSKETINPAIQKKGGDDLNYEFTYEYDTNYAHRLTRAGSEQKGWRYYTYDANGNVTSESDGVAPNEETTTLTPVTVTTHTNEEGSSVYEADYAWAWSWSDSDTNSGNKASPRNKRTYEWNSRNLLMRSVALGYDTRYAYSADGNRAAKWTAGNLSETLYFNTMWTWHIDKGLSQEQQGQYSKHIYLGETRLVTKQTSDLEEHYGPSEELHHQYYYHPDHLGSAQLVTDYEGNEYQRIEYTPYGELWVEKKSANEKDMRYLPYKFTAKEQDEETGLYYYGARYLDAKYSRWLSTDPAVSDYVSGTSVDEGGIYNTINFSLYHYAGNNPIKYTDPGNNFCISRTFGLVTNVNKNNPDNNKNSDTTRAQVSAKSDGKPIYTNPTQVKNGTYKITAAKAPSTGGGRFGSGNQGLVIGFTQDLPVTDKNGIPIKDGGTISDSGYMLHITDLFYTNGCGGFQYDPNNAESRENAEAKMNLLVLMYEITMSKKGGMIKR